MILPPSATVSTHSVSPRKRDAGAAEEEGFLLQPARIREHDPCAGDEADHVQVSQGFNEAKACGRQPVRMHLADALGGPRVHREHNRPSGAGNLGERVEQSPQGFRFRAFGTVHGRHEVAARGQAESFQHL